MMKAGQAMNGLLLNTPSQKGGQVLPSEFGSQSQSQGFSVEGSFREKLNYSNLFPGFSNGSITSPQTNNSAPGTPTDISELIALLKSIERTPEEMVQSEEALQAGKSMTLISQSERTLPEGEVDLGLSEAISDNFTPEELVSLLSKLSLKEMKDSQGVAEMDLKAIEKVASEGGISLSQLEYAQKALSKKGVEVSVMDLQKVLTISGYSRAANNNESVYVKTESLNLDRNASQSIEKALFRDSLEGKDYKSSLTKLSEPLSFNKVLPASNVTSNLSEGSAFKLDSGILTQKSNSASEWFPITVNRQTGEWGKELMSALGDRLRMQVGQGVKEASVRLDPPELGRVDFTVRLDGDRVNVQINSNNQQVRELLAQQIDRLRMDLSQDNGGSSVDVNVGDGKNRQGEQQKDNVIANNYEDVVSSSNNELKLETANLINNNKLGLNTKV